MNSYNLTIVTNAGEESQVSIGFDFNQFVQDGDEVEMCIRLYGSDKITSCLISKRNAELIVAFLRASYNL